MNNINQKNTIFSLNSNSELPYASFEYVNHATGKELNSHYVNTSLQQLLDNDLYIENMLQATSAYMNGPKAYDEYTISSKPNGYKVYGSLDTAECLDIWRKEDKALSASIVKVANVAGAVNFICQHGDILFVGTDSKLLYKEIKDGQSIVEKTPWNELLNKASNNYWKDNSTVFFGASDGVYQLSTYVNLDDSSENQYYGKKMYAAVKLNSNDIGNITAVAYSKKNKIIIAAAGTNVRLIDGYYKDPDARLYIASYNAKHDFMQSRKLKFSRTNLYSWSGSRCSIVSNNHVYDTDVLDATGDIVVGTHEGFYTQYKKQAFKDYSTITPLNNLSQVTCNGIIEFNNELYAYTSDGIFKISPDSQQSSTRVLASIAGNIVDACVDTSTKSMYIAKSDKLYRVDQMMQVIDISQAALNDSKMFSNGASICKVIYYKSAQLIVAAVNHSDQSIRGCYYFKYDSSFLINKLEHSAISTIGTIVDICDANNNILLADNSRIYALKNISRNVVPSGYIKQIEQHVINGNRISKPTLKAFTLHNSDYSMSKSVAVMQDSIMDMSTGTMTFLDGAIVADCIMTDIDGIQTVVIATSRGAIACALLYDSDLNTFSLKVFDLDQSIRVSQSGHVFELVNSLVFTDSTCAYVIPKTAKNHVIKKIDGNFTNPAAANGILYGIDSSSAADNVHAYQEYSNTIKDTGILADSFVGNINIYCNINDAIAAVVADGVLSLDFLSATLDKYEWTISRLSSTRLAASGMKYAAFADYNNSEDKILYASTGDKTTIYASIYHEDNFLSSDYLQLSKSSATKVICNQQTNCITKYQYNGAEVVIMACNDGIYVHEPSYARESANVKSDPGSTSTRKQFGVACLYVDDPEDTSSGHEYAIDLYDSVKLSGAAYIFNNDNVRMMTAHRFSYAYVKGTSQQITAYYQPFKSAGGLAPFCDVSAVTFNAPGEIVDAFNYFNEFISWNDPSSQFYTAYFMTQNAIYRKANDTGLIVKGSVNDYNYNPGKTFTVEADNSNTQINGKSSIDVKYFINGDVSYGRNPYIIAACSLQEGSSISSDCLLFYKIRDNSNAADIGHFAKNSTAIAARAVDLKSVIENDKNVLEDDEHIQKAYFYGGPDISKSVIDHTNDSDWTDVIEWEVKSDIVESGIYSICILTNKKVFTVDINLDFSKDTNNFSNAVYVSGSYFELYDASQLQFFDKKSIQTNRYDHIIAIIDDSVINVVNNMQICKKGNGNDAVKDVFPMNGLFENGTYTYYLLTNNGCVKISDKPSYLVDAIKCGHYNTDKAAQSVFYNSSKNVLFLIVQNQLFALTDEYTKDLQSMINATSPMNISAYKQTVKYNGADITGLIGCYSDENYLYCYTDKQVFRFEFDVNSSSKNIIIDGSAVITRNLTSSSASIKRIDAEYNSSEIYPLADGDNSTLKPYSLYMNSANDSVDGIFFEASSGIYCFDNNYIINSISNPSRIKSAYALFSAGSKLLGALSGSTAYLEQSPGGTLDSYNLGFNSALHYFYDDYYNQLFIQKSASETVYGNGIVTSAKLPFNGTVKHVFVDNGQKYLCTSNGIYKADSYSNYVLNPRQSAYFSKKAVSFNPTNGSRIIAVTRDNENLPLTISQYNINNDEWTDVQLYTFLTSCGFNSKGEVSATNTHKINVYPISAFYSNNDGSNTLYCQLSVSDRIIEDINSQARSTYGHDNFIVGTNCLYDVNYGNKNVKNYEDVTFSNSFANATNFYKFKNYTLVCNGAEIDLYTGYGYITCFMCIDGTNDYSISGITNGSGSDLVLNTDKGICIYNGKKDFIQGKNIVASAVGKQSLDGKNYKYLCTAGNQLFSSDNYRIWKPMFNLVCNSQAITDIRSICSLDSKTFCFGNSNGLYCTKYQFSMIKDVKAFTQSEALVLYEDLMEKPNVGISAQVSSAISAHVLAEHCYEKDYIFLNNKEKFLDSTTVEEVRTKVKAAYAAAGISIASGKPKEIVDKINTMNNLLDVFKYIASLADKEQNGTSLISHLNNDFVDINMEDIDVNWQNSIGNANDLVIKNDIVSEIYFGKWLDGDVVVQVSNFLNAEHDDEDEMSLTEISSLTYIMKRWMSGMTELYINIPTTNTYYIANTYGAADCTRNEDDAYQRPNLYDFSEKVQTQSSKLSEHYTSISVGIASCEYHIDNLLGVQINGNSLPLKIYKDDKSSSSIGASMYRSMSQPSLLKSYDLMHTDEDGNYIFNFAVFGSDAQAVMLQFYDSKARSNQPWIRVTFDPNGGEGEMPKQKFLIKEDGSLEQKTLKGNKFINKQGDVVKIFNGWTISPQPENYSDWDGESYDGTQVYTSDGPNQNKGIMWPHGTTKAAQFAELVRSLEEPFEKKEEITLYASWITYQFSESDTTIMMNSDTSQFNIAAVGLSANTKLKDNVVINFGD